MIPPVDGSEDDALELVNDVVVVVRVLAIAVGALEENEIALSR